MVGRGLKVINKYMLTYAAPPCRGALGQFTVVVEPSEPFLFGIPIDCVRQHTRTCLTLSRPFIGFANISPNQIRQLFTYEKFENRIHLFSLCVQISSELNGTHSTMFFSKLNPIQFMRQLNFPVIYYERASFWLLLCFRYKILYLYIWKH